MDFTIKYHEKLIQALVNCGYDFLTVNEYLTTDKERFVLLRHDVEAKYENALEFAKIQNKHGINGTYYFRILKDHFKPEIVKEVVSLGHEAGYHYDDLAKCKGDMDSAIQRFESHLKLLNEVSSIATICQDGSPLSKYDNKALWKKYHYKDYGILSEPYFDIDFNEVYYLTDTGRMWDGNKYSVRDKVNSTPSRLKFHYTSDIINAANNNKLPDKIMFTFHPQRWTNNLAAWTWELVYQNFKNQVKRYLVNRPN